MTARPAAPKEKSRAEALLNSLRQYAGLMRTYVAASAPPLTLSTSGDFEAACNCWAGP